MNIFNFGFSHVSCKSYVWQWKNFPCLVNYPFNECCNISVQFHSGSSSIQPTREISSSPPDDSALEWSSCEPHPEEEKQTVFTLNVKGMFMLSSTLWEWEANYQREHRKCDRLHNASGQRWQSKSNRWSPVSVNAVSARDQGRHLFYIIV